MVTEKTARNQRSNADPGPNTIRYTGAPTVLVPNDIAAPARPVNTPRRVKWVAGIGIPVSLIAAAAVSFAGLTELGAFAGIQHPWLMPVAIDVYATTATLIAMLLPEGHHARHTAVWHARLGLAMSMGGNATARALHLGASGSVATVSGALLTFVGAWPSLIVERLLQLQGRLAGGAPAATATEAPPVAPETPLPAGSEQRHPVTVDSATEAPESGATTQAPPSPATATEAPQAPAGGATEKNATAARKRHRPAATVTEMGASGGLSLEQWAERAEPVYLELMDRDGAAPSAPRLIAELVRRGAPAVGPARGRLVRKATEDRLGLTKEPGEDPEPGDESFEEAG